MKFNAPKTTSWLIALLLGLLGLLGTVVAIPFVSDYAFWFVFVGLVLMLAATYFEGL
ncbi:MAG: hypothetical protein BWY25_02241 [Chloroflexi bacterium ADurb.Bin222]|nr:MAG: hypothetical protein BWY25_02241 [Chloroflexi bacterium ADurb.Bin222]